jgi:hypothetical protein
MNNLKLIPNFLFWKSIDDPMFGILMFNKLTADHWRGKVNFAPTGKEITIYLFDLKDKVSEEHKQFYVELENRYSEIVENIGDLLHKTYTSSIEDLSRQDVWKTFGLTAVSFPLINKLKASLFTWDIYYSYHPEKPTFVVEMDNWQPKECYSGE